MKSIRLRKVPKNIHHKLFLILKHEETRSPDFVRPLLDEIIEENKKFLNRDVSGSTKEILLSGVSDEVFFKLIRIATNKGLTVEQLIRQKLDCAIYDYPIKLE